VFREEEKGKKLRLTKRRGGQVLHFLLRKRKGEEGEGSLDR